MFRSRPSLSALKTEKTINYFFSPPKKRVYLVFGLAFLMCIVSCLSQTSPISKQEDPSSTQYIVNVQHFSTKKGMSHWNANTILQDSRGFIWVGTNYGLNRFNGHRFEVFTKESHGLGFNKIKYVLEDDEGWLWLFRHDPSSYKKSVNDITFLNIYTLEVLSLEERFGAENPLKSKRLNSGLSNSEKSLFFSTASGELIQYNSESGFIVKQTDFDEPYRLDYMTDTKEFYGVIKNFQERKGLLTNFKMNIDGKITWSATFPHYISMPPSNDGRHWLWRSSMHSKDSRLELLELSKENKINTIPNDSIPNGEKLTANSNWVRRFFHNPSTDTYWYKSRKDFWVFHPEKGLLYDFKLIHQQIIDDLIEDLFFDNRNNVWAATQNGLYKIQLKPTPFRKYLSLSEKDYSVNKSHGIRGMTRYQNQLLVASEMGQFEIDLNTNKTIRLDKFNVKFSGKAHKIKRVRPVLNFDQNELIIGGNLLYIYNAEERKIKVIQRAKDKDIRSIWSIFRDQHQTVWLGLEGNGLEYWDRKLNAVVEYDQYNAFKHLRNSTIYAFLEWDKSHLLIGSTAGIYVLHQQKGIIGQIWNKGKGKNYFPHNLIYHFHRDKEDSSVVWVATGGGGLVRWTVDDQKVFGTQQQPITDSDSHGEQLTTDYRQFTTVDGLTSNVIYAVYEDENCKLWLPGDHGIIRLNKEGFASKAYLEQDGISHREFNRISHYEAEDGTLYFGGLNGLTAFHPDQLQDEIELTNAPLQIVQFEQFDETQKKVINKTNELIFENKIELRPGDKFFNLEFALLDYQNSDQVRYSYRIEGRDVDWQYLEGNKLSQMTLPYGDYTLHVRGQSANGLFSKNQLKIPILVESPIYLKAWFLISSAFLLAGFSFLFYYRRTHELKNRQKELEQAITKATKALKEDKLTIESQARELRDMDKLKSRFFANVSHELRTPLTLLLAPIQSVLNKNKLDHQDYTRLQLAKNSGQRLRRLVNEILDLTKLEAGRMELIPTTLVWYNFLKKTVAEFESFANQKNIEFTFHYEGNENLQVRLDKKKTEVILMNLLSNAFKFTPKNGKVSINVKIETPYLTLTVSDTGRGIHSHDVPHIFNRFYQSKQASNGEKDAPVEGGTGIGLALSQEFVHLMKGKISVISEFGIGSQFCVKLPLLEVISQISTEDAKLLKGFKAQSSTAKISKSEAQNPKLKALQSTDRQTILLVEDNYDLRRFIKSILEEQYHILEAENGEEALKVLHSGHYASDSDNNHEQRPENPKLILSDIMMPIMDGYQLLSALKSNSDTAGIPVIMLTAKGGQDNRLKALRIGVDDYMLKPFDEEELLVRIKNLLCNVRNREVATSDTSSAPMTLIEEIPPIEPAINDQLLTTENQEWLSELEGLISEKIENFDLTIEQIAYEMAVSPRHLARRLKALVGLTPSQYLKTLRYTKARDLLENRTYSSVKAVAFSVGFKDVVHFSRQFKVQFGKLPSTYL